MPSAARPATRSPARHSRSSPSSGERSAPRGAHAEKAKSIVGGVGGSRSWLGANAAAALGSVLAAEGDLAEAERELAFAEHFFRDEVATRPSRMAARRARARSLPTRAPRRRGGRRCAGARGDRASWPTPDESPSLAAEVVRELEQARERRRRRRGAGTAERGGARGAPALCAPTSRSAQIAATLFLSPNTVRSHTRAIYRKLGVNSRADAVARADALGLCRSGIIHVNRHVRRAAEDLCA